MNELDASRNVFKQALGRAKRALSALPDDQELGPGEAVGLAEPPVDVGALANSWPVLNRAALRGLVGAIVETVAPHTEADPVALLASIIAEFGTMLNRGPHLVLDGSYHPLLFWPVLVGTSSKSRKGTAGQRAKAICVQADTEWTRGEYKGTLSSGEGLCFAVRDPQYEQKPVKEKGQPTGDTFTCCVDSGVADKRLFLQQAEFGAVLRVMEREGNSLSGVLRDAWDGQDLAPMTKSNRVKATQPHIGIVAHVTNDELLRNLTDTEASNGFGNRFSWTAVRRSKELPFPSNPDPAVIGELAASLGQMLRHGRSAGHLQLSPPGRAAWGAVYHDLSSDRPGLAGSLLARSEAQVMRLSALYCLLDGMRLIGLAHLESALALWQYCEDSTRLIFGDSLGDPCADTILGGLRTQGELSETEVSQLFGRNLDAKRLERAKALLAVKGLAHRVTVETGGRPRVVWRPGTK